MMNGCIYCVLIGTLSPMSAFKEDLKIPFRVTLENPHVIRYESRAYH